MIIKLNRIPYICPVIEDHTGERNGHYMFTEKWIGFPINLILESEDDRFWLGVIETGYEGQKGWMRVELIKECFDVVDANEIL